MLICPSRRFSRNLLHMNLLSFWRSPSRNMTKAGLPLDAIIVLWRLRNLLRPYGWRRNDLRVGSNNSTLGSEVLWTILHRLREGFDEAFRFRQIYSRMTRRSMAWSLSEGILVGIWPSSKVLDQNPLGSAAGFGINGLKLDCGSMGGARNQLWSDLIWYTIT